MPTLRSTAVLALFALTPHAAAQLGVQRIFDASYFDGLPATVISFELDGAGNPVDAGFAKLMAPTEYAGLGVTLSPSVWWVDDTSPCFDAAQAFGGSPSLAIPGVPDEFFMDFDPPVRSVGAWVVQSIFDPPAPRLEAFDAAGNPLGSTAFVRTMVDGSFNGVGYGFMGLASDTPIARVRATKDSAQFDDLTFSVERRPGPHLALAGICPGPHSLSVAGLAPGEPVVFLASVTGGTAPYAGFGCGSQSTLLAAPIGILGTTIADAAGEAFLYVDAGPALCGTGTVQVLVPTACQLGNPATLSAAVGPSCF